MLKSQESGFAVLLRSWWMEFLSSILAAWVFAAVVVVVKLYDGKSLQSWHADIALSTLLNIAGLIIQFCLTTQLQNGISQLKWLSFHVPQPLYHLQIYDKASRGIAGLPGLLLNNPRDKFAIALSLLILSTLPIGAFVQQSVVVAVIPVATNETAKTTVFAVGRTLDDVRFKGNATVFSNDGQQSLWAAALKSGVHQHAPISCATGNCTFPTYESLAVCSLCANMKHAITIHHPITDKLVSESDCHGDKTDSSDKLDCKYKLPGGLSAQYNTLVNSSADIARNDTILGLGGFAIVSSIYTDPKTAQKPRSQFGLADYKAQQCVLYFCSHVYSTVVVLAIAKENITLTRSTSNSSKHSTCSIYDEASQSCRYTVSNATIESLRQEIYEMYNGSVSRTSTSNKDGTPNSSNSYMSTLFQRDLSKVFQAIAGSLTSHLRAADPVNGTATADLPYFQMNTVWLVFPGIVIFLTCVMTVVISIQAADGPLWKDSALALVEIGRSQPDDDNFQVSNTFRQTARDLEASATSVRLRITNNQPILDQS